LTTGLITWSLDLPQQVSGDSTTLAGSIAEVIVCVPQGCPAAVNGNLNQGAVLNILATMNVVNSAALTFNITVRVSPWTFFYSDWFVDDQNPPPTLHRLPLRWHRSIEQNLARSDARAAFERVSGERKTDENGKDAPLPDKLSRRTTPVVIQYDEEDETARLLLEASQRRVPVDKVDGKKSSSKKTEW